MLHCSCKSNSRYVDKVSHTINYRSGEAGISSGALVHNCQRQAEEYMFFPENWFDFHSLVQVLIARSVGNCCLISHRKCEGASKAVLLFSFSIHVWLH